MLTFFIILSFIALFYILIKYRGTKFFLIQSGFLLLCFLFAYVATESNLGAETFEHEEGVSIRQDSNKTRHRSLFIFYSHRSHMGGGLSGGK